MSGLVLRHRLPALVAALLSSCALSLLAVSGTTCSFLTVSTRDGQALVSNDEESQTSSHDLGILCGGDFFYSDNFANLSQAFFIVAIVLGTLCTLLSWAVSILLPPTDLNWKVLSILAALSAVIEVPIFLLFETEACTKYEGQTCSISNGVLFLIGSVVCFIFLTLYTQCLDPPRWAFELDAWKVKKRKENIAYPDIFESSVDEDGMDEVLLLQRYSTPKSKSFGRFGEIVRRWYHKRRWANSPALPLVDTESASRVGDDRSAVDTPKCQEAGSYYANSNNSRLLLKLTPDGKRIGDDQKSIATFGDLDDMLKLAENQDKARSPSTSPDTSRESDVENDSKLLGEELVRGDQDNLPGMQENSKRNAKSKALGKDRSITLNKESAQNDGVPLIITNAKNSHERIISGEIVVPGRSDEIEPQPTEYPRGDIISNIRAFTVKVKRDVTRRMNNGRNYTVVNSDCGSQSTLGRQRKEEDVKSRVSSLETGDMGASAKIPPKAKSENEHLVSDWNALFASSPPVIVTTFSQSSAEDDPEDNLFSSDGTPTSFSMSSFGANDFFSEGDASSVSSSSSMPESSDFETQSDDPRGGRQQRGRRRTRRQLRRSRSMGNSVASRTSLLDTTIDEETDLDLEEFESSDAEDNTTSYASTMSSISGLMNYPTLTRTKSAPNVRLLDSGLSSTWMHGVDSFTPQVSASSDSDEEGESETEPSEDKVFVSPESDKNEIISSGAGRHRGRAGSDDGHVGLSANKRRRCRSLSLQRSRRIFRDDNIYTHGIHSPLITTVSSSEDDSSGTTLSEASLAAKSTRSALSHRGRRARIRRLHREAQTRKRSRARTLDPPKNRWRSSSKDDAGLSAGVVSLARYGIPDYGSDEASL